MTQAPRWAPVTAPATPRWLQKPTSQSETQVVSGPLSTPYEFKSGDKLFEPPTDPTILDLPTTQDLSRGQGQIVEPPEPTFIDKTTRGFVHGFYHSLPGAIKDFYVNRLGIFSPTEDLRDPGNLLGQTAGGLAGFFGGGAIESYNLMLTPLLPGVGGGILKDALPEFATLGAKELAQVTSKQVAEAAGKAGLARPFTGLMGGTSELARPLTSRIGKSISPQAGEVLDHSISFAGGSAPLGIIQAAMEVPEDEWKSDPIGATGRVLQAGAVAAGLGFATGGVFALPKIFKSRTLDQQVKNFATKKNLLRPDEVALFEGQPEAALAVINRRLAGDEVTVKPFINQIGKQEFNPDGTPRLSVSYVKDRITWPEKEALGNNPDAIASYRDHLAKGGKPIFVDPPSGPVSESELTALKARFESLKTELKGGLEYGDLTKDSLPATERALYYRDLSILSNQIDKASGPQGRMVYEFMRRFADEYETFGTSRKPLDEQRAQLAGKDPVILTPVDMRPVARVQFPLKATDRLGYMKPSDQLTERPATQRAISKVQQRTNEKLFSIVNDLRVSPLEKYKMIQQLDAENVERIGLLLEKDNNSPTRAKKLVVKAVADSKVEPQEQPAVIDALSKTIDSIAERFTSEPMRATIEHLIQEVSENPAYGSMKSRADVLKVLLDLHQRALNDETLAPLGERIYNARNELRDLMENIAGYGIERGRAEVARLAEALPDEVKAKVQESALNAKTQPELDTIIAGMSKLQNDYLHRTDTKRILDLVSGLEKNGMREDVLKRLADLQPKPLAKGQQKPETVVKPAIKFGPYVFKATAPGGLEETHASIYSRILNQLPPDQRVKFTTDFMDDKISGFVTDRGRYVDRAEAKTLSGVSTSIDKPTDLPPIYEALDKTIKAIETRDPTLDEVVKTPQRDRVKTEITQAFGSEATKILPVVDAYARGWAIAQGKTPDDFYNGLYVVKGGTPGSNALYSTLAWHGSPNVFDFFSTDFIGVGEGQQTYGWGLYFTSHEGIAETYRKMYAGPTYKNISRAAMRFENKALAGRFSEWTVKDLYQILGQLDRHPERLNEAIATVKFQARQYLSNLRESYQYDQDAPWYKNAINAAEERLSFLEQLKPEDFHIPETREGSVDVPFRSGDIGEELLAIRMQAIGERLYRDNQIPVTKEAVRHVTRKELNYDRERLLRQLDIADPQAYKTKGLELDLIDTNVMLRALEEYDIDRISLNPPKRPGRIYQVELTPDESHLLDWNKPLSEQSAYVQSALEKLSPEGDQLGGYHPRDTGQMLYEYLVDNHSEHSQKAVSSLLNSVGIPGLTYIGRGSGKRNYVIFDDKLVKIIKYYQKQDQLAQGSYEMGLSGQRTIRALEKADSSTLPHEIGHDFLEHLPLIDPALAERAAKALGAQDFVSLTTDHKEAWARGFEAYLREGIAPSSILRRTFETYKRWLVDVYRSIVGTPLEGKLNPELKKVFDEMLTAGDKEEAKPNSQALRSQILYTEPKTGETKVNTQALKKAIGELDVDKTRALRNDIEALVRRGQIAKGLYRKWLKYSTEEDVGALVESLKDREALSKSRQKLDTLVHAAKYVADPATYDALLEQWAANNPDFPMRKLLFENLLPGMRQHQQNLANRHRFTAQAIQDILKIDMVKEPEQFAKYLTETLPSGVTRDEALWAYALSGDKGRVADLKDYGIRVKGKVYDYEDVLRDLTPRDRKLVDHLKTHFQHNSYVEKAFSNFVRFFGYEPARIEGWFTSRRGFEAQKLQPDWASFTTSLLRDVDSLKSRVEGVKEPFDVTGGFYEAYQNVSDRMSIFGELGKELNRAQSAFIDPRVQQELISKFGTGQTKSLELYLSNIYEQVGHTSTPIDRAINQLTTAAAASKVSFNLFSAMKQSLHVLTMLADGTISAKSIRKAMAEGAFASSEVGKRMTDNSGMAYLRYTGGRYLDAMLTRSDQNVVPNRFARATHKSMVLQRTVDRGVMRLAYRAAEIEAEAQGLKGYAKQQKVNELFDVAAGRDQPTDNPLFATELEIQARRQPLLRGALLFQREQNRIYNVIRRRVVRAAQNPTPENLARGARALVFGVAGTTLGIVGINALRREAFGKDNTPETAASDIVGNLAGMWYLAGPVERLVDGLIDPKVQRLQIDSSPIVSTVYDAVKSVWHLSNALNAGDEELKSGPSRGDSKANRELVQALDSGLASLSATLGLPVWALWYQGKGFYSWTRPDYLKMTELEAERARLTKDGETSSRRYKDIEESKKRINAIHRQREAGLVTRESAERAIRRELNQILP